MLSIPFPWNDSFDPAEKVKIMKVTKKKIHYGCLDSVIKGSENCHNNYTVNIKDGTLITSLHHKNDQRFHLNHKGLLTSDAGK